MLRLDLGPDELAATRFACSALQETVASLRVLDDPTGHTMHLPWYRDVAEHATRFDLGLLRALVPANGYAPDFISPPPDSPLPDLDADLARVAATPPDRVHAEIAELCGSDPPPVLAGLLADPAAGLQTVVAQLRRWFDIALNDHWPFPPSSDCSQGRRSRHCRPTSCYRPPYWKGALAPARDQL